MSEKKFFDADAEEVEIEKVASAVAETAEKGAGAIAEAADNAVDTAEGAAAIADNAVDAAEEAQDAVRTSEDMVDANRVWLNKLLDKEMEHAAETAEETEPGETGESGRKKKVKSVGREILSWVLTIAIAFLAAIFINAYLFRISKVSGGSMDKTLHDGQTVFISRAPYFFSQPKYNDIVVFDRAQTHRNFFVEIKESLQYNVITLKFTKKSLEHKYWIKRVIGLPGDTIEIKEDGVYRNGVLLDETYVNPAEVPRYSTWIGRTWVIGEGEVFVMGDNRNHSTDSRVIGPIKINSILGKVIKK